MAQKIVGYREMNWTCPNCGTINPGSQRTCKACGSAMGQDVKFDQQANAQIIKDEKVIEQAKKGPDVYCAYCGNRNPAGTAKCVRCGADLSEGSAREHGQQYRDRAPEKAEPLLCPSCGAENPAGTTRCRNCGAVISSASVETVSRTVPAEPSPQRNPVPQNQTGKGCRNRGCLILIIFLIIFAVLGIMMSGSFGGGSSFFDFGGFTDSSSYSDPGNDWNYEPADPSPSMISARVTAMNWETSGTVVGNVESAARNWKDQLPSDARNISCAPKLRYTYDEEYLASGKNYKEVCGEAYTVDLGNGYEALTQDCVYEVYEDYCSYTVTRWGTIGTKRASGSGTNVGLPQIEPGQQFTDHSEKYTITLQGEDGRLYTVNPSYSEYQTYRVGDRYTLSLDRRGRILQMEQR